MLTDFIISTANLQVLRQRAIRRMQSCRLWDGRMSQVLVSSPPFSAIHVGWQSLDGIGIPQVSLPRLACGLLHVFGCRPTCWSPLWILLHEYGHAYADLHPSRINQPSFRRLFAGGYDDETVFRYDGNRHLTRQASRGPAEDFAETFAYVTIRGGRQPAGYLPAAVKTKAYWLLG